MSTPRPTPETDAAEINLGSACGQLFRSYHSEWYVKPSFARKLERERDEARDQLKAMREVIEDVNKILRSIQLNDIFDETMRNHATCALTKLQPFLP